MLAREIELAGIPTVMLSQGKGIIYKVKPPRCAITTFPRGATVGEPYNGKKQKQILKDALKMLEECNKDSEIRILDYKWEFDESR